MRDVLFPDTQPLIRAVLLPRGLPVGKRFKAGGGAQITYRNDSGALGREGLFKQERYGVNVWHPVDREANRIAREGARSCARLDDEVVVMCQPGAGPFEVRDETDELEELFHYYFTIELMVRGSR